jgi:hypothetical protein
MSLGKKRDSSRWTPSAGVHGKRPFLISQKLRKGYGKKHFLSKVETTYLRCQGVWGQARQGAAARGQRGTPSVPQTAWLHLESNFLPGLLGNIEGWLFIDTGAHC